MRSSSLHWLPGLLLAIGFSAVVACNDSEFKSSDGTKAKDQGSGTPKAGDDDDDATTTKGPGSPTGTGGSDPSNGTGGPKIPPGEGNGKIPVNCIEGDKVNYNPGGEAGACIESGRTYNFDLKECQDMRAAEYDCTWDGMFGALEAVGIQPTAKLQSHKDKGGKMITCGQSADKALIVAQILVPPDGQEFKCVDGKIVNGQALTGCYGGSGGDGLSQEEKEKFVYGCITRTND